MATPAPSLEDLPPERGTILELHSIGRPDFDGMLVEFYCIDKSTGKYSVISLDEREQPMKVKAKCCKRPDIKPLELRELLSSLSLVIRREFDKEPHLRDTYKEKLQSLLNKDPCCVPAHETMSLILIDRHDEKFNELSDTVVEKVIQHFHLAIANFCAYQDICTEEDRSRMQTALHFGMLCFRGLNATARYQARALSNIREKTGEQKIFAGFYTGWKLFHKTKKVKGERPNAKETAMMMQAAEHFLNTLKVAANLPGLADELYYCVRQSLHCVDMIANSLAEDYHIWKCHDNERLVAAFNTSIRDDARLVDELIAIGKNLKPSPERYAVCKRIMYIDQKYLEACSAPDGSIKLMLPAVANQLKERIQLYIKEKAAMDEAMAEHE
jgi:hypothetical protein